jgi:hypothetical protein
MIDKKDGWTVLICGWMDAYISHLYYHADLLGDEDKDRYQNQNWLADGGDPDMEKADEDVNIDDKDD